MLEFAVLGVGNDLLQDDGAGIHTVRRFAAINSHPDVDTIDGGTIGLALMAELSGRSGLIVIDAMRLGKPAGTVSVLEGADMDACLRNHCGSAHEVGISDLMDALRLSGDLPARRALVGIEPESIEWGTEPTHCVANAIDEAASAIHGLLGEWRRDTARGRVA